MRWSDTGRILDGGRGAGRSSRTLAQSGYETPIAHLPYAHDPVARGLPAGRTRLVCWMGARALLSGASSGKERRAVLVTDASFRTMQDPVPRLRQVVLDTRDARVSAEFWRQLLGLVYRPGHEAPAPGADDPAGEDWLNLQTSDGSGCLAFQQVDELPRSTWPDARIPQQLHLDLSVPSKSELDLAHSRVMALGGELRLDRSNDPEEALRVYADPDGHTFCIFVSID
jgi:hypothetical protein